VAIEVGPSSARMAGTGRPSDPRAVAVAASDHVSAQDDTCGASPASRSHPDGGGEVDAYLADGAPPAGLGRTPLPIRAWLTLTETGRLVSERPRVRFVVDRLPKVQASNDLDHDDRGEYPIDDHAEGWPPSRIGDEVGAVLPEVFETVTDVADD
jgi:hypothetical protein